MADSEDDGEALAHRTVARFLKDFGAAIKAEVDAIFAAEKAESDGTGPKKLNGGTPFMESDDTPPTT